MTAVRYPKPQSCTQAHAHQSWFSRVEDVPQVARFSPAELFDMKVVSAVLPFRVSRHVVDNLIDWNAVPQDPIFRIVFPRRDMLSPEFFQRVADAMARGAGQGEIRRIAAGIHRQLNPHPGGQQVLNVPMLEAHEIEGLQHKYRETVLFFPSEGQTCHAFCSFCFRWAQFVHDPDLRMAMAGSERLAGYLRTRPHVTDLLITGGDPFVIKTRRLRSLIEPLLGPDLAHITTVRFGTKAIAFRPQRFTTDPDAADLRALLASIVGAGKHVAVMTHFNHWREVEHPSAMEAIRAVRATGAALRSQSPILRGINDDADVWARMWRSQVNLGISPYYMFIARDTGAQTTFDLPLIEAWRIYAEAASKVSGLGRTARGPVMSASPGKIEFLGPAEIAGERVFSLRFLQARDSSWCYRPFFAAADDAATWFGDLRPAFGAGRFFFEAEFDAIIGRQARVTAESATADL